MSLLPNLLADLATLVALVTFGFFGMRAYITHRRPHMAPLFLQRQLAVVVTLMLLVIGLKVFEDVLGQESGVVDDYVLRFVHTQVPSSWSPFFAAVTWTGSVRVLGPAAAVLTLALALGRRRGEALLIAASLISSTVAVYVIKTLVGRARPSLWETQWYWGSSFPSGHTLSTAAFATAAALTLARVWPRAGRGLIAAALGWTLLVALSRLVLGVHWPSDVVAALCVGALIPLAIRTALDLHDSRAGQRTQP